MEDYLRRIAKSLEQIVSLLEKKPPSVTVKEVVTLGDEKLKDITAQYYLVNHD